MNCVAIGTPVAQGRRYSSVSVTIERFRTSSGRLLRRSSRPRAQRSIWNRPRWANRSGTKTTIFVHGKERGGREGRGRGGVFPSASRGRARERRATIASRDVTAGLKGSKVASLQEHPLRSFWAACRARSLGDVARAPIGGRRSASAARSARCPPRRRSPASARALWRQCGPARYIGESTAEGGHREICGWARAVSSFVASVRSLALCRARSRSARRGERGVVAPFEPSPFTPVRVSPFTPRATSV